MRHVKTCTQVKFNDDLIFTSHTKHRRLQEVSIKIYLYSLIYKHVVLKSSAISTKNTEEKEKDLCHMMKLD